MSWYSAAQTQLKRSPAFRGPLQFLSNFYTKLESPIVYANYKCDSVERAFQLAKTLDDTYRKQIHAALSTHLKMLGREAPLRPGWDEMRDKIMLALLYQKFNPTSNPRLHGLLIATRELILVETNYWHDNYWGDCTCVNCDYRSGLNKLGKLLMQVRREYRFLRSN